MSTDPKNPCPMCGGPKTYGARRCKNCPRTDTPSNVHQYIVRWFPMLDLCESCQRVPPLDRHHKDGNRQNNAVGNIAFLCRRCHMEADGRLEFARTRMPRIGGKARHGLFAGVPGGL